MSAGLLVLSIVGASLVLVGTIVFAVLRANARATQRGVEELQAEGIVRDSGTVRMRIRLQGFHAPGLHVGTSVRSGPGRLVFTRRRLTTLPRPRRMTSIADIALENLGRFQVGVAEGALQLVTTDPPGATGTAEITVWVTDAQAWVSSLAEAGARQLPGAPPSSV